MFGPRHKPGQDTGYLKKKAGTAGMPVRPALSDSAHTRTIRESIKPPIVKASEQPVMGIKTTKNFITANAVEAILTAPKNRVQLEPNYSRKEDFGKVPAYLTQVKEEIRRENEMIDRYVKDRLGQGVESGEFVMQQKDQQVQMSEEDRAQLVNQLKAKWDVENSTYQRMTHMTRLDTVGKRTRKLQCEQNLKDIENSLERLTRPGPVYIR